MTTSPTTAPVESADLAAEPSAPTPARATTSRARSRTRTWLPWPVAVLLAAPLWWGLGFLPWFVHGPGIGVPNLSGVTVDLPLVAEHLTTLVVGSLIGATLAGLTVRLVRPERRRLAGALCALVVAVVAAVLVLRSRDEVSAVNAVFGSDPRVLNGLVIGMIVVMCVAVPQTFLVAAGPRWLRGIVLAGSAVLVAEWLADLFLRRQILEGSSPTDVLVDQAPWVGAVLLGLALAYIGWRSPWRALAFIVGYALAWVAASLPTMTLYLGTLLVRSGDDRDNGISFGVREAVDGALDVALQSLRLDSRALGPWVLAAVLGLALGLVLDRRRARVGAERDQRAGAAL